MRKTIILAMLLLSISLASALDVEDNIYPNAGGHFSDTATGYYLAFPFILNHSGNLMSLKTKIGCDVLNGYNTNFNVNFQIYDGMRSNVSTSLIASSNTILKNCSYPTNDASVEAINFTISPNNIQKNNKYYLYFTSPDDGMIAVYEDEPLFNLISWEAATNGDYITGFNIALNLNTIINTSDTDNDLSPDEDDLCPFVYGTINGCPDIEPPNVTIISPLNDTYQTSFNPQYNASDSSNYSCEILNSTIFEGVNYWQVNCTDIYNNSFATPNVMFKIDTIAPIITLLSPINNSYQIEFLSNYSVVELNPYYCFSVNDSVQEGWNMWQINCSDEAGNSALSEQWSFKKDTIPPTTTRNLTILSCSDNFLCQNTFYSFNGINFTEGTEFNLTGNLTNISYYSIDENNNTELMNNEIIINDTNAPEISLSYVSGILYANTNENSTCYYNTSTTNLTLMDNSQATLNLPYGSYSYYVECFDLSGNKNNSAITITLNPPSNPPASSSSSGSSSSSDGFNMPKISSNKENIIISVINPGEKKDIKISNKEISIKQISIEVNNQVKNIDITITKEAGKPASVEKAVTDNEREYQYLTISHPNLESKDIKKGVISFEVDKKWMEENAIVNIVLKRYSEEKWQTLNTHKTIVDVDKILYEAETPGFSTFAIVGEKDTEAPVINKIEIPNIVNNEIIKENVEKADVKISVPKESWFKRNILAIIPLIIAIIAGIAFFSLYGKNNGKKSAI